MAHRAWWHLFHRNQLLFNTSLVECCDVILHFFSGWWREFRNFLPLLKDELGCTVCRYNPTKISCAEICSPSLGFLTKLRSTMSFLTMCMWTLMFCSDFVNRSQLFKCVASHVPRHLSWAIAASEDCMKTLGLRNRPKGRAQYRTKSPEKQIWRYHLGANGNHLSDPQKKSKSWILLEAAVLLVSALWTFISAEICSESANSEKDGFLPPQNM